jgi:valyl-tRNA synthetase
MIVKAWIENGIINCMSHKCTDKMIKENSDTGINIKEIVNRMFEHWDELENKNKELEQKLSQSNFYWDKEKETLKKCREKFFESKDEIKKLKEEIERLKEFEYMYNDLNK